jgi:N6-L-threonylcarbamoyladenine synthase
VRILGIETSCDETAAAVVDDGVMVRSSVVATQTEIHAEYAGVVPELASRAHVERITPVIEEALHRAGATWREIDAVAVGHRPGLIGSLLIGVSAAKSLAWSLGVPFLGVDHVHAHLYAGVLHDQTPDADISPDGHRDRRGNQAGAESGSTPASASSAVPATHAAFVPHGLRVESPDASSLFPALGFVVSGGHTALYVLRSWIDVTRLGSTIDDAMGEAYDKAAAILGVPFPGGPNVDRLARTPGANDRAVDLPISRLSPESLDFSFSGLKTAVKYAAHGVPEPSTPRRDPSHAAAHHVSSPRATYTPTPPPPLTPERVRDLCASFQRAACGAAIFKIDRAIDALRDDHTPHGRVDLRSLLIGGGVSANSRLRGELADLAARRSLTLHLPRMEYCVDNAAMIAGLAFHLHRAGLVSDLSLQAHPATSC